MSSNDGINGDISEYGIGLSEGFNSIFLKWILALYIFPGNFPWFTKLLIEVDGRQHFKDNSYFKSNAIKQCEQVCKKMKIIFKEGYSVIRIGQEDIWLAKTQEEMLSKLKKAIQECIDNNGPMIHYISMDDSMYDNHEFQFKKINK